jgi:PAS domain S-box-containing protein
MDAIVQRLHPGLQSVLDTALDAVVVIDSDSMVLGWNRKAETTFGWQEHEACGQPLTELIIPHRHRESHQRGMARYLATGEGPVLDHLIEIEALRRDGREIKIELSITCSDQFGSKLFIGFLRNISERTRQAEQRERLLRELNHRVKNSLSLVGSIAHLTAQNSAGLDQFVRSFGERLNSLAAGHDLLVQSQWGDTSIDRIAGHVLGAAVAAGRADVGGPAVEIDSSRVVGLSMILHELFTNASKHGALSKPVGHVSLCWWAADSEIVVEWSETGLSGVTAPNSEGFGLSLVAMSAMHDLGGSQVQQWRPEGLRLVLRFPARG